MIRVLCRCCQSLGGWFKEPRHNYYCCRVSVKWLTCLSYKWSPLHMHKSGVGAFAQSGDGAFAQSGDEAY
jgi:hypothetical protein